MATMSNSESRRLYSWWWDSHISPKNSKWLQENLTDMDAKVKLMIKLIEEDADSFARRAEMYYKKRPELMKLVEEFYRAYRALAERYDYATGELRHAQRTMAAAFLDQVPHGLPEDSSLLNEMFLEAKMKKDEKSNECESPDEAECEIQNLEKALTAMLAEKESLFIEYQQSSEKFSNTDRELNCAQEESKKLNKKAKKAEKEYHILKGALGILQADSHAQEEAHKMDVETQNLMKKLDTLESKNEGVLLQYLDRVSVLEKKISMIEEEAAKAGEEIEKLTNALSDSNEKKEVLHVLYEQCLKKICKLELDLSSAQEEVKYLNSEILKKAQKIQHNEENCVRLEMSNQSLKMEVGDMAKKIMSKDQELCEKQNELAKLQSCVKDEHKRYVQVEATLQAFQSLHNRSQEEQRDITLELQNCIQMLKDLEMSKDNLEEEMQQVKDDNKSLNELNATMETEILGLRQMKQRLEEDVSQQLGQSSAMEQEIFGLKEEIEGLKRSYEGLISQLDLVGLNQETVGQSVKDLQDENSRLREIYEKDEHDEEGLSKRIENIEELTEKNNVLVRSLFDANCELQGSREKVEELEKSCQLLHGEKSTALLEKTMLLCQLHIITVNMVKLMDESTDLEKSLATAHVELEGLREKSKGLEELCQLLNNEKSRSMVTFQNESVEQRLEILEKQNHFLEEESKWKKKEVQEELDRAVIAQFENFILHKFIEDIEERNYTLMVECEKHIEASKLADKLISELETENLEQQVEEELLVVEIESLRSGIYQVFSAFEIGSDCGFQDEDECEQLSVDKILSKLKAIKCSFLKYDDDKQRLVLENKVILTLLQQLKLDNEIMKNDYLEAMKEKLELVEMNRELMEEVHEGDDRESILKGEVDSLHMKQGELQRAYLVLQEEYSKILKENVTLLKDFSNLKEDSRLIEEESNGIILETFLALDNISTIFMSCTAEKTREIRLLSEDLRNLRGYNNDLEKELIVLGEKLDLTQIENLLMQCTVEQLESKLKETENMNSELGLAMEEMMMKCGESKVKVETLEKETVKLSNDNANLNAKVGVLNEEIEERKMMEENLASELQVRENEFELWDAEATSFYFDLQVSNIRDVLFENKVHELTGVCESFEGETASKDQDLEEMKEKVSIMESEIEGLRSELLAYTPVIGSLKESIASLEHNSFVRANHVVADNQKPKDVEVVVRPLCCHTNDSELTRGPDTSIPNGVFDLMELQARIIAVEKAMVSSSSTSIKKKTSKGVTQELRSTEEHKRHNEKSRGKSKVEIYEAKKKVQIRDIPLDQASDGPSSRKMLPYEPQIEDLDVDKLEIISANLEEEQGIFSQKLASDAQKLSNLQEKVNNLMTKLETKSKRGRKRKLMGVDLGTLKEQLQEIQENVLQLVNVNGELTEKNPSSITDQEKASERITRLQLEAQKIQYVLLKLDDDDEIKRKRNSRFSRIILRGFMRHGRISSNGNRHKKNRFCGCLTPSTKGDSRSQM